MEIRILCQKLLSIKGVTNPSIINKHINERSYLQNCIHLVGFWVGPKRIHCNEMKNDRY